MEKCVNSYLEIFKHIENNIFWQEVEKWSNSLWRLRIQLLRCQNQMCSMICWRNMNLVMVFDKIFDFSNEKKFRVKI